MLTMAVIVGAFMGSKACHLAIAGPLIAWVAWIDSEPA